MFSRIMYITLFVSDQDKALDFYTNFGFQKRIDATGPDGRFLTMALKDQAWEVLLWPGSAGQARTQANRVGALFIESDDLRRDFAELKARGVEFAETEPAPYPFGMLATALDPDGNPVALRQRRK